MGFPYSIFKNRELLLQWRRRRPSCAQAKKTLSFRGPDEGAAMFGCPSSGESRCFTETSEEGGDRSEETIIRDVMMRSSDRLFFEDPRECAASSLIVQPYVEEAKEKMSEGEKGEEEERSPIKEGVIVAMETKDPYRDFKRSMQEMVECYITSDEGMKLKNWEWLQELLGWYLKMNVDGNHGYILGAFVDLLVELYAKNYCCCSCDDNSLLLFSRRSSYSSALSSPFTSSLGGHLEIEEEQGY